MKRSWPALIFIVLAAVAAGTYIWCISWQGFGANSSRMIALQIIVAALAVWIHYLQTHGKHIISSVLIVLSLPLIWLVIQSQWLHLHMIYDASLLDQRITILVGEAAFLLLAYLGGIIPRRTKDRDSNQMDVG